MEDAKTELVYALTRGSLPLTLVSICGIRGTGKTTLAKNLFRSQQIQDHFNVCSWLVVSTGYQTRDILQQILSAIPERLVDRRDAINMPQNKLAELVLRSLKGRRYLIVLDDVSSADAWHSLCLVFPDDNIGSRILITTRVKDVALQVGGPNSHIHMMRTLDAEESWELWRRYAGLYHDTEVNQQRERIGREIARRSGGLPLTIVVLARTLREQQLDVWKLVLEQFRSTSSDRVFYVLNLSYKNLPLHLMRCLLYLGTFPEYAEIEMDTVCQLLIDEGLVLKEHIENGETMMDVAARYLDELYERSFVQIPEDKVSGQSRSCKIHDLIRDFCRWKGKEDEFFEVIDMGDKNDQTMSSAIRRCAIYLDKYEYTHPYLYGNEKFLRSLLLFSTSKSGTGIIRPRDIPNLDHLMLLRVLYLYGVDFKDGKLPKGIEKLVNLRCLSSRECYLEELSSSVGNMFNLETLDLRIRNECELTIPDVLNNLGRLKYLYLPVAYRTHDGKKLNLGRLKELEILDKLDPSLCNVEDLLRFPNLKKLAVTTDGDVSEIERILMIAEHTGHLRSLSLNIRNFHCHSERRFSIMAKVFHCGALHALEVRGYLGKLPDLDTRCLKLTQIVLNSSKLAEEPMQILQKLPSLRILVLEIEAYIGMKMKCSSNGFRELRYLKLSKLYNLEEWEVEEEAMPKLCTLVIENCKELKMLPDGLQFVTELRKLEIASMPSEFVGKIQKPDGTKGVDFYKIGRAYPIVEIDGQFLIVKEMQQAGPREDRQSCWML